MKRVVGVACSGGPDSLALLHATVHAAPDGIEVVALHVHHGLQPQADAWARHLVSLVTRWARGGLPVSCCVHHLRGAPARGDSVEAWARDARYAALAAMAKASGAGLVLLAHHRRDQAETFLLQALRGAGAAGLAGMPADVERDGLRWARPWLSRPRSAIDAYIAHYRLFPLDDPSNGDQRFARNRLRHGVWPSLLDAFPDAEAAFATAGRWAWQAHELAREVGREDLQTCASPAGLDVRHWLSFSEVRRANALRLWLELRLGAPASATLVERLLREVAAGNTGTWPAPGGQFRQYRGRVTYQPAVPHPTSGTQPESSLSIDHPGRYALPGWGGTLVAEAAASGGVPITWLAHVALKARTGGERFQGETGRPPRSLKKQYQAAAVPAWQRDGPLVYSGARLLFAPGLGVDARVHGAPGQPQMVLSWAPSAHIGAHMAAGEPFATG